MTVVVPCDGEYFRILPEGFPCTIAKSVLK